MDADIAAQHDLTFVKEYLGLAGEPCDQDTARARYESAAAEAQLMLDRPAVWAAVDAVAKELLTTQLVTRERVEAILDANGVDRSKRFSTANG